MSRGGHQNIKVGSSSPNGFWTPGSLIIASIFLAGLGVILGCVTPGGGSGFLGLGDEGPRVAFPHAVHIVDQELECSDCHEMDEETGQYKSTSAELCLLCHNEEEDNDAYALVQVWYENDEWVGPRFTRQPDDIIFDHQGHTEALGDDCALCHGDMSESESLSSELYTTKKQCMDCHQERGASNSCDTCHKQIRQDRMPVTHGGNFVRTHGLMSQDGEGYCELCHTENSCTACHLEMPPQNHNNQFRRRGHGILSSMDRESCQTCHESDFCRRCHEEVLPISHRGSFGNGRQTHCMGCHLPVSSDPSCSVCHRETPNHVSTPKPPDHNDAMDCRLCHGINARLPHVDNGSNCNFCHR